MKQPKIFHPLDAFNCFPALLPSLINSYALRCRHFSVRSHVIQEISECVCTGLGVFVLVCAVHRNRLICLEKAKWAIINLRVRIVHLLFWWIMGKECWTWTKRYYIQLKKSRSNKIKRQLHAETWLCNHISSCMHSDLCILSQYFKAYGFYVALPKLLYPFNFT